MLPLRRKTPLFAHRGQDKALRQASNFESRSAVSSGLRLLIRIVVCVGLVESGDITVASLYL